MLDPLFLLHTSQATTVYKIMVEGPIQLSIPHWDRKFAYSGLRIHRVVVGHILSPAEQ